MRKTEETLITDNEKTRKNVRQPSFQLISRFLIISKEGIKSLAKDFTKNILFDKNL